MARPSVALMATASALVRVAVMTVFGEARMLVTIPVSV